MHAGSQRATTQKQESTTTQPNQRDHKGINTFLQNPEPTTAKSRQASKNPLRVFCFPEPIAQTKASKRQWTASTLKGNTNLKNGLPRGISPCANGKFYFLFLFGCQGLPFRKGRQAKRKKREKSKQAFQSRLFLFLIEREKKREKRKIKAGFFLKGKKEKEKRMLGCPPSSCPGGECPPDPPRRLLCKNQHRH
jgi:hypothetical protein